MKISVAQIRPIKGNILANIKTHKTLIDLAILHNADAIFFPELSITGYEPELAIELVTNQESGDFDIFQDISNKNKITIGIGMPTNTDLGTKVSMLIFQPFAPRQTYSKQLLHTDESPFFINSENQIIITVENKKIAPAICYESLQTAHSEIANNLGAEIYIASVAKSQSGIDKAMLHYPAVAKRFSMPVLMSNCIGYCNDFQSVGKSSVWTKQGDLVGQIDDKLEGILVFNTETEEINEQIL